MASSGVDLATVRRRRFAFSGVVMLVLSLGLLAGACWSSPSPDVNFDYQIGGDYNTAGSGVSVVSRDWFSGSPLPGANDYSICYVNAFQTQENEESTDRPDEQDNWPPNLVLTSLGDDPNWGGEYLIDISTGPKRALAAGWVSQMVQGCADKGFDAVEFDNLDSWTRFDETPIAGQVPFGQAEAVAYATIITEHAHGLGLAVAQKNTSQLTADQSLEVIGFDFAIAEECGRYNECTDYTDVFTSNVYAVEYTDAGFATACNQVGNEISVVRRDRDVSTPGTVGYRYQTC